MGSNSVRAVSETPAQINGTQTLLSPIVIVTLVMARFTSSSKSETPVTHGDKVSNAKTSGVVIKRD